MHLVKVEVVSGGARRSAGTPVVRGRPRLPHMVYCLSHSKMTGMWPPCVGGLPFSPIPGDVALAPCYNRVISNPHNQFIFEWLIFLGLRFERSFQGTSSGQARTIKSRKSLETNKCRVSAQSSSTHQVRRLEVKPIKYATTS